MNTAFGHSRAAVAHLDVHSEAALELSVLQVAHIELALGPAGRGKTDTVWNLNCAACASPWCELPPGSHAHPPRRFSFV